MGIVYAALSVAAHLIVMPSRLAKDSHSVDWFFAQSALAIRIFPLDHALWTVPGGFLKVFPAGTIPGGVAEKVLDEARRRDPYFFAYAQLPQEPTG